MNISIFKTHPNWLENEIYLHGLKNNIQKIFAKNGGPIKISKQINKQYSTTKEWASGRKPISINDIKKLLSICENDFKNQLKKEIENTEKILSCKYSWRKIKFPNKLTKDLAYITGLLLGDGSLAGDNSNKKGNWDISVFFDNKKHQKYFDKLIFKEFGFYPKHRLNNTKYYTSYFCSKVMHYFFRTFFELPNSYKSEIISTPKIILSAPLIIKNSFIRGLFDSDGTFTSNEIRYSTTSQTMVKQVKEILNLNEIFPFIGTWQKKGNYKLLYTVYIRSKNSKKIYFEKINFSHPNKKLLLNEFIKSSIV